MRIDPDKYLVLNERNFKFKKYYICCSPILNFYGLKINGLIKI
jgi:hypothetical protein